MKLHKFTLYTMFLILCVGRMHLCTKPGFKSNLFMIYVKKWHTNKDTYKQKYTHKHTHIYTDVSRYGVQQQFLETSILYVCIFIEENWRKYKAFNVYLMVQYECQEFKHFLLYDILLFRFIICTRSLYIENIYTYIGCSLYYLNGKKNVGGVVPLLYLLKSSS